MNLSFDFDDASATSAIVDSGTSFLLIPNWYYYQLYADFKERGMYCEPEAMACACTGSIEFFPDIEIYIENVKYIIPKESYVKVHSGDCLVEIMPGDRFILGLNFFLNYYTVFD